MRAPYDSASVHPPRFFLLVLALAGVVVGATACSDDVDLGDERAAQARRAALDAGLEADVADFLSLAARGAVATYQATYPGPVEASELVVANDPPDRRVDVVVDDVITEVRLVVGGESFSCQRDADAGRIETCSRTDALVEGPGLFGQDALEELTMSLAERTADYQFAVETTAIAGVEATCLVTTLQEGRADPSLGERGSICVSPEGALLRLEQAEGSIEAMEYTTDIPDNTFARPDLAAGD